MERRIFCCLTAFLILKAQFYCLVGAEGIGVNYGMQGNDLPSPNQVVALCKSKNITRLRLFDPNPIALKALQGSGIEVVLGVHNLDIDLLARGLSNATEWINTNVMPYAPTLHFRYISVGNEVIPSDLAEKMLPALQNLDAALKGANLSIPVTTSVFLTVLGTSYPPSKGEFSPISTPVMTPIVQFLEYKKYPLLCNVYPSFAYSDDPKTVRLDYAIFNTTDIVVKDGELGYKNIFDAMVDAMYSALEKAGAPNVEVVVSECGWPSGGNDQFATIANAQTHNNNLIGHVTSITGTPKRPGKSIETYIFALFNENLKEDLNEQHWGLFYPNMTEVYHVNLSPHVSPGSEHSKANIGSESKCGGQKIDMWQKHFLAIVHHYDLSMRWDRQSFFINREHQSQFYKNVQYNFTNHFSGPLPATLSSCRKLKTLSLTKKNFHGEIPYDFANLASHFSLCQTIALRICQGRWVYFSNAIIYPPPNKTLWKKAIAENRLAKGIMLHYNVNRIGIMGFFKLPKTVISEAGHASSFGAGLVLSTDAKPRLKWTPELHEGFIKAVKHLGGADSEGNTKDDYETHGDSRTYPIPSKEPFTESTILGCAIFTAYGAMRHAADMRAGDAIAVIGISGVRSSKPMSRDSAQTPFTQCNQQAKDLKSKLHKTTIHPMQSIHNAPRKTKPPLPSTMTCQQPSHSATTKWQSTTGAQAIGVNYGMQGNDLPRPDQVVAFCKSKNITRLRLFNPDPTALKAIQGSGIELVLGVHNMDLDSLGKDPSYATNWVNNNVIPYAPTMHFRYISVGNEVIPGDLAANVLPALQNLDAALKSANLSIPVSTSVFLSVLGISYPPSKGEFSESSIAIMKPIVQFLESKKYPLLCNVYPSFAYSADPVTIRLDYAIFNTTEVVVKDGELGYKNMFDAMVDALYSALEKAGAPNVEVVVSESGWPSAGNDQFATITSAQTYNNNLIAHATSKAGTPKRPGKNIETYVFAMFNENLKQEGTEQHWGLFYPNMSEVYHVDLTPY
ncbi:hypothetical protein IFM89_032050 [Coptis chinensis]|uniref:Glucan endo-1,3-beta-D-glucosidase n=1 Tax=Coptis chinensis TaxID=261450 RepID=A0A835M5E7_9MAGN|nr:hypothetical protein IFM89_032050 [Coptis chinensis]